MHHALLIHLFNVGQSYLPLFVAGQVFSAVRNFLQFQAEWNIWEKIFSLEFTKNSQKLLVILLADLVAVYPDSAGEGSCGLKRIECLQSAEVARNHQSVAAALEESDVWKSEKGKGLWFVSNIEVWIKRSVNVVLSEEMQRVCSAVGFIDQSTFHCCWLLHSKKLNSVQIVDHNLHLDEFGCHHSLS